MLTAYKEFWKRYADFKGQSSRSEYWYAFLANSLINFVLFIIAFMFLGFILSMQGYDTSYTYETYESTERMYEIVGTIFLASMPSNLYGLATFIPTLAIAVRRLRDAGYPWGLVFIFYIPAFLMFIPIINILAFFLIIPAFIAFIVLLCQPTKITNEQANYGTNPYTQPQPFGANNQNFNQGVNQPFGQGQPGQPFGQNGQGFNQQATNQQGQAFNQQASQPFGGQTQQAQPFPQNNQAFNQEAANQTQNLNQASAQPFGQNGQQPSQPFGQSSQNFNQGQAAEPVASQPFPQPQPVEATSLAEAESVQANQATEPIQPAEPFGQAFTQAEPNPTEEAKSAPEAETGESSNTEE